MRARANFLLVHALAGLLLCSCSLKSMQSDCTQSAAPKIVKGKINNDRYQAQDGSFSINLPYPENSVDYVCAQMKEIYRPESIYLSFGPTPANPTIFRVNLLKKTDPASANLHLDHLIDPLVSSYKVEIMASKNRVMQIGPEKALINDFDARRFVITESPNGDKGTLKPMNHHFYAIDNGKAVAVLGYAVPLNATPKMKQQAEEFVRTFQFGE